jgi:hypothetical protein
MNPPRWTQIPAQRSPKSLLQAKFYVVVALLGAAALLGPISFILALAQSGPELPATGDELPEALAQAETVAVAFLTGQTTRVPATAGAALPSGPAALPARAIAWSGFETGTDSITGRAFEVHAFLVTTAEQLLELHVTMTLTEAGPILAALPALSPVVAPAEEAVPALDYTNIDQEPVNQGVLETRVTAWARAYANVPGPDTDQARALKDATGDTRPDYHYPGLTGFSAQDVELISAVGVGSSVVVRARVELLGPGGFTSTSDFDLLVSDVTTDRPLITAWGPAGSALELRPGANAVFRGQGPEPISPSPAQ